ncbi:enolase C-terminal domain-like protein [Bosea sp. (in: a-proteobacteria)]|jgi:galactonate dehydratase|uniref:enolase C-terminal domain-like protein n=1 Tax=Bosea sp. (in: a-proteobacteria) TaxID=1871050 RepID=UPI002DDCEA40|nr:enolase C-terminal domain-like protein [Bosea sp. (in: a-proteobacteria)]HEV2513283.1 enolase C-terminal domain-like protein [Bosea sp. (in: a-proteobacteria)]
MTVADRIERARLRVLRITDKTRWVFLELAFASGVTGLGEASLNGRERQLVDAALGHLPAWLAGGQMPDFGRPVPLPLAAVATAFDVARRDAAARREGKPLAAVLGAPAEARIPLYANINRRTRDRSPAGHAASARDALAAGFAAVKIAPFDDVTPALSDDVEGHVALQRGLDRIGAVRAAVGSERRLLVDCHWRFSPDLAWRLVEAVREHDLYWLECPVAETPANLPLLGQMRRKLNASGTLLAGLEEFSGAPAFLAFADVYDVMMPDMKYVGGVDEMLRTGHALARRGVAVSPHNPTGPVCHAASLHLSAALPGFGMLEVQFDETPLFFDLGLPRLPGFSGGASDLPAGAGLGLDLDEERAKPLCILDLTLRS